MDRPNIVPALDSSFAADSRGPQLGRQNSIDYVVHSSTESRAPGAFVPENQARGGQRDRSKREIDGPLQHRFTRTRGIRWSGRRPSPAPPPDGVRGGGSLGFGRNDRVRTHRGGRVAPRSGPPTTHGARRRAPALDRGRDRLWRLP
jgi:hypothetical protein